MKSYIVIASVALFTGCTTLNLQEPFKDVEQTIFERTGHKVVWDKNSPDDEKVKIRIAEKLKGRLSLHNAIAVSLLNNPSLQAEYSDLGVAQAELVQAGLLANPTFMIERRVSGRALESDVTQDFLSLFLIHLRQR
jgi:outer membrane protein, heavy metal efflux system